MSKNLIIIILIIVIQAIFAALNIKNVSDVSIGIRTFTDVPVFITITISFIIGVLIFFPVAFIAGKNHAKSAELKKEAKIQKKLLKEKNIHEIKPMEL
ncbi:MAG: hypothetical protein FWD87_02600 [Spirochaetaceae bacterium]|nr:hypothetical protein [Spirochaetaceae bacterium]